MVVTRDTSETMKQGKRHLYKMYVYECVRPGKKIRGTTALVVVTKSTVRLHHLQKRGLIYSLYMSCVRPYLGYYMQLWASPFLSARKTFSRGPHGGQGGSPCPVGRG